MLHIDIFCFDFNDGSDFNDPVYKMDTNDSCVGAEDGAYSLFKLDYNDAWQWAFIEIDYEKNVIGKSIEAYVHKR